MTFQPWKSRKVHDAVHEDYGFNRAMTFQPWKSYLKLMERVKTVWLQ